MKNIITKISIIFTGCLLIFSILGFPILSVVLGYQIEAVENIWILLLVLTLISSIVMIILIIFLPPLSSKHKNDILKLGHDNFSSFYNHLEEVVQKQGFAKQAYNSIEGIDIHFFIRNYGLWEKDCIAVIRTEQLSDGQMKILEDTTTKVLGQQFGTINFTSIICVDRITPTFERYISTPAVQMLNSSRFKGGISFGDKKCYMTNADKEIGLIRYNRLKKLFLSLI